MDEHLALLVVYPKPKNANTVRYLNITMYQYLRVKEPG